jgi:hypothetical protein
VLLQDVIDNLKIDSDYYKKKTMTVHVGEGHGVFKLMKEEGLIKQVGV